MHGLGNDFIVINAINDNISFSKKKIKKLSDRRMGIGFDQLLIVEKADSPNIDFNYRIFNVNGNEVEHCGNGARCFAKYVITKGLTKKRNIKVKIKTGIITITYHSDDNIAVDMGEPIKTPKLIPFKPDGKQKAKSPYTYQLNLDNKKIEISVISMGNPHAVIFCKDLDNKEIQRQAKLIQASKYFPNSANINYVEILNKNEIKVRTYERDVGETKSCGTGASASAYLAYKSGLTENSVQVHTVGGELAVKVIKDIVYMSGPASFVFDGVIRQL